MRTSDPGFRPPHCPNPRCVHHRDATGWRWQHYGWFERKAEPRHIRRFRCLAPECRRTFSTQTFDTTYYLKRPDLQVPLFHALTCCSGLRQFARVMGVEHSTAQRQASRLGRHCLLFEAVLRPRAPTEDVALDGLVTFEHSQYRPFEILPLVGCDSHYVYGFTLAELRRSGRMTDRQKHRRAQLESREGRADPRAVQRAVVQLLRSTLPEDRPVRLRSDEHVAYERAVRQLPHAIERLTVPSRRCRTWNNPLFAIDLLDLLIRHCEADHKRETIAFAKRRQGAAERFAVFMTWRNHVKRTSERRRDSQPPAQILGIRACALKVEDVLVRRLFPSLVPLPDHAREMYWREVKTRPLPNGTRHELTYAA